MVQPDPIGFSGLPIIQHRGRTVFQDVELQNDENPVDNNDQGDIMIDLDEFMTNPSDEEPQQDEDQDSDETSTNEPSLAFVERVRRAAASLHEGIRVAIEEDNTTVVTSLCLRAVLDPYQPRAWRASYQHLLAVVLASDNPEAAIQFALDCISNMDRLVDEIDEEEDPEGRAHRIQLRNQAEDRFIGLGLMEDTLSARHRALRRAHLAFEFR